MISGVTELIRTTFASIPFLSREKLISNIPTEGMFLIYPKMYVLSDQNLRFHE